MRWFAALHIVLHINHNQSMTSSFNGKYAAPSICLHMCESAFSGAWEPASAEDIAVRPSSVDRGRGGSPAILPAAAGGSL